MDDIRPGQGNPSRPMTPLTPQHRRTGMMIIGGLLLLSILVPYYFWRGTWFGRRLTDRQMEAYLNDTDQPRHLQHALVQFSDRLTAGDREVQKWRPQVEALARHDDAEVRITVAWVMGQDNTSGGFRQTLREMLGDAHPMVRRNAALSLVRFNDRSGKSEILAMLQPFVHHAPKSGKLLRRLVLGDTVNPGTLLARLETGADTPEELRSPLAGTVREWLAEDETEIETGQPLVSLAPSKNQAWEALRALFLIGESADLALINRIGMGAYDLPKNVRQQAILTADAIQQRMAAESTREAESEN